MRPPARAAADHGLAALLGDRDARRRVPLRPGRHPGPPVPRGRPAVRLLRPHPAGPGRQPGQAHRRALGRGRRRLPGRQLPALWSEWNGRYRDTVRDFWRGEPAALGEFASRLTGSSDLYQADSRHPGPASTSSPPTTASPCAIWSPTTRSTTRPTARTTPTARATTDRGTAAPRVRPTTRASWRCGTRSSATSWPPCCCPRACRMLVGGDELGRTQGGNNNAYCQDNEVSWFDWAHVDQELLDFTRRTHCPAPGPPGVPAPTVVRRPGDSGDGRPRMAASRRGAHGRRRLGERRGRELRSLRER